MYYQSLYMSYRMVILMDVKSYPFNLVPQPRSELGPAPPFPPMRVLEVQWSHALSLVREVALG